MTTHRPQANDEHPKVPYQLFTKTEVPGRRGSDDTVASDSESEEESDIEVVVSSVTEVPPDVDTDMLLPGTADRRAIHHPAHGGHLSKTAVAGRFAALAAIVVASFAALYLVAHNLPDYEKPIYVPHSFDELKAQSVVLQEYSKAHFYPVLAFFTLVYLFKQTFSVPGSALMNLLGGLLYGFPAFLYVSVLTAGGSTLCYVLAKGVLGEHIVGRFASSNLAYLRRRVDLNRENGNLFYYLLFLRLFPFSPNWALNVAAPFVGVPILPFFWSVFLGLMPYNYICVQAATTLAQLTSFSDILSLSVLFKLVTMSVIALVPAIWGEKMASWIRGRDETKDLEP
ncbi:Transmembrane protein 41A [Thoreauomyces humboldtii]|nr:Transmembrane protein 41A [Thoreauomyces humboldtii]